MGWWRKYIALTLLVSRPTVWGEFQGGPIQLIRPGSNHEHLETVPETLRKLRNIRPPVAVISAVGAVHSGKSFLLNRLWDTRNNANGFAVGYTVKPETSGLWMWEGDQRRGGTAILYLDTEGFFSPNVTETYDAKLFAISTLLSSEVIYNTVKFIDNHHLELLELLIRRTNLFGLRAYARQNRAIAASGNHSNGTDAPITNLASFLRALLPDQLSWVIQDFVQDLRGVSPEEWLQSLIDLTMSKTGDSVGGFFTHIDCVPLPVPATDPETLGKLDLVDPSTLNPGYIHAIDVFRDRLVERAIKRPKFKGGTLKTYATHELPLMSGADLADLVEFLVAAANGGEEGAIATSEGEPFPEVPSINQQFSSLQLRLMKSDIIAIAERDLNHAVEKAFNARQPLARFPFEKERSAAEKQARMLWDSSVRGLVRSAGADDEVENARADFDHGLSTAFERVASHNCELIDKWCEEYATELKTEYQEDANKLILRPKNPSHLDAMLTESMTRLDGLWSAISAPERGGWNIGDHVCCRGAKEGGFTTDLREIKNTAVAANDKLIVESLDKTVRDILVTAQSSLNEATAQGLFQNVPEKKISDFFQELRTRCLKMFDDATSAYQSLLIYKVKQKELEKAVIKHQQEIISTWTQKCTAAAEEFLSQTNIRYPYALRRAVSLPADEFAIQAVVDRQSSELRKTFERVVFCHASEAGKPYVRKFETLLRDAQKSIQVQNVRAIKEISDVPLADLKRKLLEEARRYYLPHSFRAEARKRTLAALRKALIDYDTHESDPNGGERDDSVMAMSQSVLEKVAAQFMEDDLKVAKLNIGYGCALLALQTGLLIYASFGLWKCCDNSAYRGALVYGLLAIGMAAAYVVDAPVRFLRETLAALSILTGSIFTLVVLSILTLIMMLVFRWLITPSSSEYIHATYVAPLAATNTPALRRGGPGILGMSPDKSSRRGGYVTDTQSRQSTGAPSHIHTQYSQPRNRSSWLSSGY